MANLWAAFRVQARDVEIVRACFAAAKRRSRKLGVRSVRTRIGPDGVALFDMSANTYVVDIFVERLRRDLPTIAEATISPRSPSERRYVALGLIDVMTRYRFGMYDRYSEEWLPTLRAIRKPAYLLPHVLYAEKAPSIQSRLDVTMDLLASWHFDEVAPEVLLEEIHTAAELLLERTVNRRSRRLSFAELVDRGVEQGVFTGPWHYTAPPEERVVERVEQSRELLLSLKDVRKDVRHRAAAGAREWLDAHFWEAAALIGALAGMARDP